MDCFILFGMLGIITTIVIFFLFFGAWTAFKKIKFRDLVVFFIVFLLIVFEMYLVAVSPDSNPHIGFFFLLVFVPIITTMFFMVLFGKWDRLDEKSDEEFKLLFVILGLMHVAIMMVLASFSYSDYVYPKIIANLIYLGLAAFFLYQISESKNKKKETTSERSSEDPNL